MHPLVEKNLIEYLEPFPENTSLAVIWMQDSVCATGPHPPTGSILPQVRGTDPQLRDAEDRGVVTV